MPTLVVTWYTEIQSNTVFINNPFPLCLIYCYIFKCTNSYTSFIHKTTGTVLYLSKFQQPVVRDSWIDVLCCHLVLLLRPDLLIFLEMRRQRQLKTPKFWNSYWYALLNRCIYDTWAVFPGTKQLNLFSHNSSLHPCSWLAKLWPSTLEAPGGSPNWLGNKMLLWVSGYSSHLAKVLLACLNLQEEQSDPDALAYYFSLGRRYKGLRQFFVKDK